MNDEILKKTLDLHGFLLKEPVIVEYFVAKDKVLKSEKLTKIMQRMEELKKTHSCKSVEYLALDKELKSSLIYKDYLVKKEEAYELISEVIEVLTK